jgi:hypothetical protein
MAIRLNQHSPQSVIPSTVNQVSRPRTSGSGKELRRPLRKNPASGMFFVALIAFAILYSPMNAMSPPALPADNLPTTETVALGRRLSYDPRLSGDNTIACASCHSLQSGVLPTFTPPRLASEAKKVRGTRRPSSIPPIALCNSGLEARLASRSKRRGQLKTLWRWRRRNAVVVKRLPADPKDVALVKPAWGTEDILAFLDGSITRQPSAARGPDNKADKAEPVRERTQDAAFELRLEGIAHHQGK